MWYVSSSASIMRWFKLNRWFCITRRMTSSGRCDHPLPCLKVPCLKGFCPRVVGMADLRPTCPQQSEGRDWEGRASQSEKLPRHQQSRARKASPGRLRQSLPASHGCCHPRCARIAAHNRMLTVMRPCPQVAGPTRPHSPSTYGGRHLEQTWPDFFVAVRAAREVTLPGEHHAQI